MISNMQEVFKFGTQKSQISACLNRKITEIITDFFLLNEQRQRRHDTTSSALFKKLGLGQAGRSLRRDFFFFYLRTILGAGFVSFYAKSCGAIIPNV